MALFSLKELLQKVQIHANQSKSAPNSRNSVHLKGLEKQSHHSARLDDEECPWRKIGALRTPLRSPASEDSGGRPDCGGAGKP
jgi:hypothetical protein